MPALDLTLLLPLISLALLAGWGLTAWLLMRRSAAFQEQLSEAQLKQSEAQMVAQQAQLDLIQHPQGLRADRVLLTQITAFENDISHNAGPPPARYVMPARRDTR